MIGGDFMEYDEIFFTEEQDSVEVLESIEVIDVYGTETYTIDSDAAFPALGETNGSLKHQLLNGKELPDQHPITSITGLREELDDIEALDVVFSNEKNHADYYLWEDENLLQETRIGLFVTLCSDTNQIRICTASDDVFGITVNAAAFVGGQADIPRDYRYNLVAYGGVVAVQCELDVVAGDYVISNNYGMAKKSNNGYGYKVFALENINGITYAIVSVGVSGNMVNSLSNDVNNLGYRMDDAETNIASVMKVANEAYHKADDVGQISEEAIKNAIEAMGKADNAVSTTDRLESNMAAINQVAVQARDIAASAEVAAERIRSEAVQTANSALSEAYNVQGNLNELISEMSPLAQWEDENGSGIIGFVARVNADSATLASLAEWKEEDGDNQSIAGTIAKVNENSAVLDHITSHQGVNCSTIAQVEQKADDNGASITSIVSSVDKYSVGEYSQAYGLTREQAQAILKPGYIYIPTAHADKRSHQEVFVGEAEINEFTPGDYYVWGINEQGMADWIEHSVGCVWISGAIPGNLTGTYKYWYVDDHNPPNGYEAYALYIWEDEKWRMVNTLSGNVNNRATSMIRQTTNEIAAEVTNARGSYTGLDARLTNSESQLQLATFWNNPETEKGNLATVKLDSNDANSSLALVVMNSEGDQKINGASIVLNNDNGDSSICLDADYINFDTGTFKLNADYISFTGSSDFNQNTSISTDGIITTKNIIANGGEIGGWKVGTFTDGTTNSDGSTYQYTGSLYRDSGDYRMFLRSDYTKTSNAAIGVKQYSTLDKTDNGEYTFWVTHEGSIRATKGNIGGWTIAPKTGSTTYTGGIYHDVGNYRVGMKSEGCGETDAAFYVVKNPLDSSKREPLFYVQHDGKLYAKNAELEGKIYVDGGIIGGWSIDDAQLYSGKSVINSNGSFAFFSSEQDGHSIAFGTIGSAKVASLVLGANTVLRIGDVELNHDKLQKLVMFAQTL